MLRTGNSFGRQLQMNREVSPDGIFVDHSGFGAGKTYALGYKALWLSDARAGHHASKCDAAIFKTTMLPHDSSTSVLDGSPEQLEYVRQYCLLYRTFDLCWGHNQLAVPVSRRFMDAVGFTTPYEQDLVGVANDIVAADLPNEQTLIWHTDLEVW
jgi:hypothetical protein